LVRRVGNYTVDLSEIVVKDVVRLPVKVVKLRNIISERRKEKHQKGNSLLKTILSADINSSCRKNYPFYSILSFDFHLQMNEKVYFSSSNRIFIPLLINE